MDRWGPLLAALGPHVVSPGRACLDCHTTSRWSPSKVDTARHAGFAFPLRGRHEHVACARCHETSAGGLTTYVGTPSQCGSCHLDAHRKRFGDRCERCHDESGWQHVEGFDHSRETGFALAGAHDHVRCAGCHGADRGRLATVDKVTCSTCHGTRHGGQFGSACDSCHKPTKWSEVPSFDHARTMFPLDRRHRAVPCLGCHDVSRVARLSPDCRACHGDPHRGRTQLACDDCHRADRWSVVRYDHDRSEFPLRGVHYLTPCRDCHTNDQYSGLRRECLSCHRGDRQRADATRGMAHARNPSDCSQCHNPFRW
jgi:hypothetical protein